MRPVWEADSTGLRFLTLTLRHTADQPFKLVLDTLIEAWRKVTRSKEWKLHVDEWLRMVEVTHGANGWHVHLHALIQGSYWDSDSLRQTWTQALERAAGKLDNLEALPQAGNALQVNIQSMAECVEEALRRLGYVCKATDLLRLNPSKLRELEAGLAGRRLIGLSRGWSKLSLELQAQAEESELAESLLARSEQDLTIPLDLFPAQCARLAGLMHGIEPGVMASLGLDREKVEAANAIDHCTIVRTWQALKDTNRRGLAGRLAHKILPLLSRLEIPNDLWAWILRSSTMFARMIRSRHYRGCVDNNWERYIERMTEGIGSAKARPRSDV